MYEIKKNTDNVKKRVKKENMMEQEKLDRINALARKQKEGTLTPAEKEEQAVLRREYIDSYKRSLVAQLENTYIVDEKGNKKRITRKNEG